MSDKPKTKYLYYISYNASCPQGNVNGWMSLNTNNDLKTQEGVVGVIEYIAHHEKLEHVILVNYWELKKEPISSIIEVCGISLDAKKVRTVSPIFGDPMWLRYEVCFDNEQSLFFYEERIADKNHFKRDELIKLLKEAGWGQDDNQDNI